MAVMEKSIIPIGTKSAAVSEYVAAALRVVQQEKGVSHELCLMGTVIESNSVDRLFDIAKKMHETLFSIGAPRIVTSIKIDNRKDKKLSMRGKIASVEDKL